MLILTSTKGTRLELALLHLHDGRSMNRREFVSGLGAAVGAASVGAHAESAPKPARKPNLIYVFADQLRYQSCGYAGDEYARTPNMDRLAAEGCNVHQAVASTPVCAP